MGYYSGYPFVREAVAGGTQVSGVLRIVREYRSTEATKSFWQGFRCADCRIQRSFDDKTWVDVATGLQTRACVLPAPSCGPCSPQDTPWQQGCTARSAPRAASHAHPHRAAHTTIVRRPISFDPNLHVAARYLRVQVARPLPTSALRSDCR